MKYYVIRNIKTNKYFCGRITTWYDKGEKKNYKGFVTIDFCAKLDKAVQFNSISYTKIIIDLIGEELEKPIDKRCYMLTNIKNFPENIKDLVIVKVTTKIEEEVISF